MILADRQIEDFPFTIEEMDFLTRHEAEIPATLDKLDKENLALLKEIGVLVRKITREQEKIAKAKAKAKKKAKKKSKESQLFVS
jgi:predicted  nucleic acid-binding Zn-ribbon protein